MLLPPLLLTVRGCHVRACTQMQDAQNAASTRALYEVVGDEQPLHHSLGPPFKELWLGWVVWCGGWLRLRLQLTEVF